MNSPATASEVGPQLVQVYSFHTVSSFNVTLYCTKTEHTVQEQIEFKSHPLDVLDVKKQIEKQFSIPICVQILSYDGHTLQDDTRLSTLRVRDGDTFYVKYLQKGHCSEIIEVITWLSLLLATLHHENPSVTTGISQGLNEIVTVGIREEFIEDLAHKYFYPWLDPVKYVNKLHFAYNGGVEIMMQVFEILQQRSWSECLVKFKYVEYGLLRVIWNFSETFPLRRAVTRNRGVKMCAQSLLRVKLYDERPIQDHDHSGETIQAALLKETVVGGLGTLCNLSELPECHMQIASNGDALDQMSHISLIPALEVQCSHYVAAIFVCLAYTPGTHKLISQPMYMERLLDSFLVARAPDDRPDDVVLETGVPLLKYFTLLYIVQVVLVSPECVISDYHPRIMTELDSFLINTNYDLIMRGEMRQKYLWSTFVPYVKLAYIPHKKLLKTTGNLQLLSLWLILFALQNMLGRENHRQVLLKEGLLDYVVCIPYYVPPSLRPQAEELVQMVVSSPDIPDGPPKLLNLVKAKLAKMHFGLEQVVSLSVSEIVCKAFPT